MPPPEAVRCRICGSPAVEPWLEKRAYRIHRCRRCGNAFVPDVAVPEDLESLYTAAYFGGGEATGYPSYEADGPLIERSLARRMRWLAAMAPPGRLLDVGAAYGFGLRAARQVGFEAVGVEISPEAAAAAERRAGVPMIVGDFLAVDIPGTFAVVTMFDVLEHMRDPRACVMRARELLAPGGILAVETGDLASPWARLLGPRWYFLDPPQHLAYFTAAGLAELMSEARLVPSGRARRFGRWVSVANAAFKLAHNAPRPFAGVFARAAERRVPGAFYVNFGDAMLLAARRPATDAGTNGGGTRPRPTPAPGTAPATRLGAYAIEILPPGPPARIATVDVEDWFHANYTRVPADPAVLPSRVESSVARVLDVLAAADAHATFFVLGCVAREHPGLVPRIAAAGHEIACHGLTHALVYEQSPAAFRAAVGDARKVLSDQAGRDVVGFRAPSWSVTERSLWALEVLVESGYLYDSSVFPAANYLYGIGGAPRAPYRVHTPAGALVEMPPPTLALGPLRFGAGGGFYLRALPLVVHRRLMHAYERRGTPFVLFIHPRELDPEGWSLRLPLSAKERLIQDWNLRASPRRIARLLAAGRWEPMRPALERRGLPA
jgi:polysaccharide deacetylase family protein (PEP-CTERM system associated)